MPIPPLGIISNQEMVEYTSIDVNGEKVPNIQLKRELCCFTASISTQALVLHMFKAATQMDSSSSRKYKGIHKASNLDCI